MRLGLTLTPGMAVGSNLPQAYLKYIYYDTQGNYLSSGYQLLTAAANGACELLSFGLSADRDGYVQVFVANESNANVWFDDLTLTHSVAPIVQENHYDPFGLHLGGLVERQGTPEHPFQYNAGSEKQPDAVGYGYSYATDWRGYDPQLGRFHGIDALADHTPGINPYQYGYNNPVMFNDPTGENPLLGLAIGAVAGAAVGGTVSAIQGNGFWSGAWKGALIGAGVGAAVGWGVQMWGGGQVAQQASIAGRSGLAEAGQQVGSEVVAASQQAGRSLAGMGQFLGQVAPDYLAANGGGQFSNDPPTSGQHVMAPRPSPRGIGDYWNRFTEPSRVYKDNYGFQHSVDNDGNVIGYAPVTGAPEFLPTPGGSGGIKLLGTARDNLLNAVQNSRLKTMIDYLYRRGAKIGSGSTADAVRYDGSHIEKLKGGLNGLRDILKKENLVAKEREIAEYIYKDMQEAYKFWKNIIQNGTK